MLMIVLSSYILGKCYYSLPVDSNYNADLTQEDIPGFVKRLKQGNAINGGNTLLKVQSTIAGSVSNVDIIDSPATFKVGNDFIVSDVGTEGSDAAAKVSSVTGKDVVSIDSKSLHPRAQSTNVSLIGLTSACYLFKDDVVTQVGSDFTGIVVDDISNSSQFALRAVQGTFKNGALLNADSDIISILTTNCIIHFWIYPFAF